MICNFYQPVNRGLERPGKKHCQRLGAVGLFLAVWLFLPSISADIIYLKSGNRLEGKILQQNAQSIVIEVAFGTVTLPRRDIARMEYEDETSTVISQGQRLLSLGAVEHALTLFQQEFAKRPKVAQLKEAIADAYAYAGDYYLQKGLMTKAKMCLAEAGKYNPLLDLSSSLAEIQKQEKWGEEKIREAEWLLKKHSFRRALDCYRSLLKIFPDWEEKLGRDMAQAACGEGNTQYEQKHFREAASCYNLALEHVPQLFPFLEKKWISSNLQWINADYLQQEKWAEAQDQLSKVLKVVPSCRPALFLTGLTSERQNDPAYAFLCYNKILQQKKTWLGDREDLKRTRELAQKKSDIVMLTGAGEEVFPDMPFSGSWSEFATPHFRIFHNNLDGVETIAQALEHHWTQIPKMLAPASWQRAEHSPCDVYLYPSKQDYQRSTNSPPWSEGITKFLMMDGRIQRSTIHLYQSAPLLTTSIIPHELTHAMYPGFINYRRQLRLWFDEGVAICSEPRFRQTHRQRLLRLAYRQGTLFPFPTLWAFTSYPPEQTATDIFYAQSYSLVWFLLQRAGSDALARFAIAAKQQSEEKALANVYGLSVEGLTEQWRKAVLKIE